MEELRNTKTEKNLQYALSGESMARNKYDWFASQAKKDGYEEIAEIFATTALNEKEHAKMWFKFLNGGKIDDTYSNLLTAAAGEREEYANMYKQMALEAYEEGFSDIAKKFEGVANIEEEHEKRYLKLAKTLSDKSVFTKSEPVTWVCRNCGHTETGENAPEVCPVCNHPQAYFEVKKI